MRYILLLLLTATILFSAQISQKKWKNGEAFSSYLEKNAISQTLLKTISADDRTYLSEIQAGELFYELREDGHLLQALIPIGEEMQIHLFKDIKGEKFYFDIIPIVCYEVQDTVCFEIDKGLHKDIDRYTNNPRLGYLLKKYYGKSVNFRKLKQGNKVAFAYRQKSRLGKPYGPPKIEAALLKINGKNKFIFVDKGGTYYSNVDKAISYTVKKKVKTERGRSFTRPVSRMRITSTFTYKRWHPILHRYRPHLGVDIGAKRGTKIYATHTGRVIYSGWMGGYGKVVKISHPRGFVSLYAHQSKIIVKRGQYVKRGQLIGYIGSTGRSTGPHLHFGLYKNKKAVDPMKYIGRVSIGEKKTEIKKITKHKVVAIKNARKNRRKILKALKEQPTPHKWESYRQAYDMIRERSKYEKRNNKL